MNGRTKTCGTALALAAAALLLAGAASAQQSPSSATTRSLNTAPAQSTLTPRPNAQPPLSAAERPQTARPQPARPQTSPPQTTAADRTLEDLLGDTTEEPTETAEQPTGVTLAPGETEPAPIPMTLGYYVRGDKDCDQVWPGEGDLAFLTPTSFKIDFGGCEPGQFLQTGPNSWGEAQRCRTEMGGDAGAYNVTYEVLGTDQIKRTARFGDDVDAAEDDLWNFCRLADVPENAQFGS
ncbi:hypothetical protein [Brevundimonas sp.]|uniref:hypothetical protein n=1 Tax=Brevundimonas sp. TaxID=1871086 RepID=UPI003D110E95